VLLLNKYSYSSIRLFWVSRIRRLYRSCILSSRVHSRETYLIIHLLATYSSRRNEYLKKINLLQLHTRYFGKRNIWIDGMTRTQLKFLKSLSISNEDLILIISLFFDTMIETARIGSNSKSLYPSNRSNSKSSCSTSRYPMKQYIIQGNANVNGSIPILLPSISITNIMLIISTLLIHKLGQRRISRNHQILKEMW